VVARKRKIEIATNRGDIVAREGEQGVSRGVAVGRGKLEGCGSIRGAAMKGKDEEAPGMWKARECERRKQGGRRAEKVRH